MYLGYTTIGLLVSLGITVIILVGFLSYSFARRKLMHSDTPETPPKEEKNDPMAHKDESGAPQKEFPAPWHAKVTTEALPPNGKQAPAAEKSPSKAKGRPAPVVIMVSGSTERPVVKKVAASVKNTYK